MAANEEWTIVERPKQKRTQDRPTATILSPIRNAKQNTHKQFIPKPVLKQTNSNREYNSHARSLSPPRYAYTQRRRDYEQTPKSATGSESYFERKESSSRKENQKFPQGETGFTRRPGVITLPQKPKTKKSKKKKTDSHYLRSVNEVSLNFSDVLREIPMNRDTNKTKISTGVTVVATRSKTRTNKSQITPRNVLDSTAPLVRRGKERVTPKNKKPTKLKRLVLEERRLIKLQKDLKKQPSNENTRIEQRDLVIPEIVISFIDSDLNEYVMTDYTHSHTDTANEAIESETIAEHKESAAQDDVILNNIKEEKILVCQEDSIEKGEVVSKPEVSKLEIETFQVSFIGEGIPRLHTKKFREYCYQMPDKNVDELTTKLLYELMKLQARQHDMNKIKSKGKKRLVFGFHEVTKHLRVENLRCIVIARDLERSRAVGGLEHQITSICSQCSTQNIQVIFALTKHTLSFSVCKPKTIVSIVGILNYDGRQEIYKDLLKLVIAKQEEYYSVVREKQSKLQTVHDSTDQEITNGECKSVDSGVPKDSKTNSSDIKRDSIPNSDTSNIQESIQLKKFELKDVEINEFVPKNFNPALYPYSGLYSPYIHPYTPYHTVYSPYYYYSAYPHDQYSQ